MNRLKVLYENIELYNAGLPSFPRNFTRDSIISGILAKDAKLLKNQLIFSARKQGTKKNSLTGEEPGKIHHEFPGYFIEGLSTEYNACDTTALFLIGHEYYLNITSDSSLKEEQKKNILNAIKYIKSHLKNSVFYEDPFLAGADKFALKVTYWKDSEILDRKEGKPIYPVTYFLAHVINYAGIRSASKLLKSKELEIVAREMGDKIPLFFSENKKSSIIAIDREGSIEGVSSDFLHALFYLNSNDLTSNELKIVKEFSKELETDIGYLTLSPKLKNKISDNYHSATVWPFEQAIINIGAKKFKLNHAEEVSRRIINVLNSDNELFIVEKGDIKKSGCDPQLWTIAAKKYFKKG